MGVDNLPALRFIALHSDELALFFPAALRVLRTRRIARNPSECNNTSIFGLFSMIAAREIRARNPAQSAPRADDVCEIVKYSIEPQPINRKPRSRDAIGVVIPGGARRAIYVLSAILLFRDD
jgi:hypothetical protein